LGNESLFSASQLKRDPLGGGTYDHDEPSGITALRCLRRVCGAHCFSEGASPRALGDRRGLVARIRLKWRARRTAGGGGPSIPQLRSGPAHCLLRSGISQGLDRGGGDEWLRRARGDSGRAGQHRVAAAARLPPVGQWGSGPSARRTRRVVVACDRHRSAAHVRPFSSGRVLSSSPSGADVAR